MPHFFITESVLANLALAILALTFAIYFVKVKNKSHPTKLLLAFFSSATIAFFYQILVHRL